MTAKRSLVLIVYSPALVDNDGRALAVVHAMERALPGLRLEWKISDEGQPIAVPERDAWLAAATARGKVPLLCNGDESYLVTVTGWERPGGLSPGGQPLFEVHAHVPLAGAALAAAVQVLAEVAEGAHAFWGQVSPAGVGAQMAGQYRHSMDKPHVPPRGLPELRFPEQMHSPAIPFHLGWLNYWSAAAARAIGFPDPSRDADLLSRAQRTAAGGWVVRLTETPLDLDTPAHVDALVRAYERFPAIGGRATTP